MIQPGLLGTAESVVSQENTAQAMGSGNLPVFATPAMIALMEQAAWTALAPYLPEGDSSVGCEMNCKHLSASPVGMPVRAEAEVTALEGKMIHFAVRAWDEAGLIGEGTHVRALVHTERFLQKTNSKL